MLAGVILEWMVPVVHRHHPFTFLSWPVHIRQQLHHFSFLNSKFSTDLVRIACWWCWMGRIGELVVVVVVVERVDCAFAALPACCFAQTSSQLTLNWRRISSSWPGITCWMTLTGRGNEAVPVGRMMKPSSAKRRTMINLGDQSDIFLSFLSKILRWWWIRSWTVNEETEGPGWAIYIASRAPYFGCPRGGASGEWAERGTL